MNRTRKQEPRGYIPARFQAAPVTAHLPDGTERPVELPKGVIGVLFVYESREAALEAYPGAPLLQMWDDTWAQKPGVEPLAAHAVMLLAAQAMDPKDTRRPGTCELCGRPMADVRRVQFRKPCRSGYFDEVKEACRSCRTRRAGNWRYAQDGE